MDLRLWIGQDSACHLLMVRIKEPFKGVRVGTMSNVMQEGCHHGQKRFARVPFVGVAVLEFLGDLSSNLIGSQTVRKAAMLTTMESIGSSSQLLDAA